MKRKIIGVGLLSLEGEGGTQCRVRGKGNELFLSTPSSALRASSPSWGRGFALLEVLVVVLIIAVLAAVALPQYQKAILKSRYSALMPIAKSIANGNEAYYLEHGTYATSPASLDVAGQAEYPDGTQIDIQPDDSENANEEYSFVIASRDNNFPLNYLVYQNHSPKFAGNIHCEADENNTMAQEVCQSLGGQYIDGSQTEGYLTYVLSGARGDNDKLPTSISKLKAQICAGLSDDECTVTDTTITTHQCTGNAATGTKECSVITYDDSGTQTSYEKTKEWCSSFPGSYSSVTCTTQHFNEQNQETHREEENCKTYKASMINGVCTPSSVDYSTPYKTQRFFEGDQLILKDWYCQGMKDGKCVSFGLAETEKNGGKTVSINAVHCLGQVNEDRTCNKGEWLKITKQNFNEQGHPTSYIEEWSSQPFTEPGSAHISSSAYWYGYAEDGVTRTQETKFGYPVYNNPNVVKFTTTNTQNNEVTNTVTCAYADADWENGTCKPGTAI